MTVEPMTDVDRIRAQWITDLRGAIAAHKHDKHMQVSPLSLACLTLLGVGDMISVFVRQSLIQLHTPNEMRGRVVG